MADKDIERTAATAREIKSIELIAALDTRLATDQGYLNDRLRSVPDLYRQWRIAQVAIEKVIDGLYKTLLPDAMLRMRKTYESGEVVIRPKSTLNKLTDSTIVLTKDINQLVKVVVNEQCAMCLKDKGDIRKCELRKALMNVCPPSEKFDGFLCEYAKLRMEEEK